MHQAADHDKEKKPLERRPRDELRRIRERTDAQVAKPAAERPDREDQRHNRDGNHKSNE